MFAKCKPGKWLSQFYYDLFKNKRQKKNIVKTFTFFLNSFATSNYNKFL